MAEKNPLGRVGRMGRWGGGGGSGALIQVSLYLNIPECFQHNHLSNLLNIEGINKVSIEGVEVGFNTGPLHDEILGHPLRVFLFHFLL